MLQGRGYSVAINALATGTSNAIELVSLTAATDKPIAIGAIQGHFTNGDSAENVSFSVVRVTGTPAGGAAITPQPMNPDDTAAGFTAYAAAGSTGVTGLTRSPATPLAFFGGNGAANYGWYPSVEEHQIILKPGDLIAIGLEIAPGTSLTMSATINVTEL